MQDFKAIRSLHSAARDQVRLSEIKMRYINGLAQTSFFQRMITFTVVLAVVPTLAVIAIIYVFLDSTPDVAQEDLIPVYLAIAGIIVVSIMMVMFVRFLRNREQSREIEFNEHGIIHVAPGKERIIPWTDVRKARVLKQGRQRGMIYLHLSKGSYMLSPYLLPKDGSGPTLRFTFRGACYNHPDGRLEVIQADNSYSYRALQKYRPDLLPSER